jgi:hypothetical protein
MRKGILDDRRTTDDCAARKRVRDRSAHRLPIDYHLQPAAPGSGVGFVRTDLPDMPGYQQTSITLGLDRGTIPERRGKIYTVEHVLAAGWFADRQSHYRTRQHRTSGI